MGLFSSISSAFKSVVANVTRVVEDVAPIAVPLLLGGIGAAVIPKLLGGLATPTAAPGAVAQATFAQTGGCPTPGILGNPNPFANPLARAALSPGFNTAALPARPAFGIQQILASLFPQPAFPQTTSFNQASFGASVAPQFRPFAPSFRSGQFGFSGQFQPGFATGLAPGNVFGPGQFAAAQQAQGVFGGRIPGVVQPGVGGFSGFGGFGGLGF